MKNKYLKSLNKLKKQDELSIGQTKRSVKKKTIKVKNENGVLVSHSTIESYEGKLLKIELKFKQKKGRDFCRHYSPYYEKPFSTLRPGRGRRGGRYGS